MTCSRTEKQILTFNAAVCFPLSAVEACQAFPQPPEPQDLEVTLWRVEMLVQRVLVLLAGGLLGEKGCPVPLLGGQRGGQVPLSFSWAQAQPSCRFPRP